MEEQPGRISVTRGAETNERMWSLWDLGEELKETVTVDARTGQSCWRPELEAGDLLPGLPNDITLDGIVSKLPWSAFAILSSVSRQWREAIESRQVFDARVRSNSTETLVVIRSYVSMEISLYSTRDKRCYKLPRIPHLRSSVDSGITSVDGKIYVVGGWSVDPCASDLRWVEDPNMFKPDWSAIDKRVYVFDPAGERKWRKCADMLERIDDVRCGVVEGKIYVFSGMYGDYPARIPEVYDPKVNAWSQILGMPSTQPCVHKVLTLGKEIFLLDRLAEDYMFPFNWDRPQLLGYHTVKDEWRVIERLPPQHDFKSVFIAQGKFHLITGIGIDVLDDEKTAWQHLHSHAMQSSFYPLDTSACRADAEEADEDDSLEVDDVLVLNDELYATRLSSLGSSFHDYDICALLRSRGFRSDRDELLWQLEAFFQKPFTFECTVQL